MNTLTNLAADIYRAADTVGREVVGFIPSATVNAETARVAVNDTVRSHSTRAATAGRPYDYSRGDRSGSR